MISVEAVKSKEQAEVILTKNYGTSHKKYYNKFIL